MLVLADISNLYVLRNLHSLEDLRPLSTVEMNQLKKNLLIPIHTNDFNLQELQELNLPPNEKLFVLSLNNNTKGKVKGVSSHVWSGPLPKQSLLRYSKNLVLCSPELMLAMLAQNLSMPQILTIAMELCGRYRLESEQTYSKHSAETLVPMHQTAQVARSMNEAKKANDSKRPEPLTSATKLRSFSEKVKGVYGYKKFAQAAKFVADNSWSPMETRLYILLVLPRTQGGFGIPKPFLNYEIEIPPELRPADGRRRFYLDMFWPEYRLAIEYDGNVGPLQGHFSAAGSVKDKQKLACLTSLGIQCISLTSQDVNTWTEMKKSAKRIQAAMKIRQRKESLSMIQKRMNLCEELLKI